MPGCARDLAHGEDLLPSHAQLSQEAAACTVALAGTCLKSLNSTEESLGNNLCAVKKGVLLQALL